MDWSGTITRMTSEFDIPKTNPLLIVISGPSGSGKDTIMQKMKERGMPFQFVVTATTRPKRENEIDGKDYLFVSKEEFTRMIKKDELLEHAIVYGDYKGIPKDQVRQALASGKNAVLRIDVQGAKTIRKLVRGALMIFITTANEEELERRLRSRKTETEESLALRITNARKEFQQLDIFDYVVVNSDSHLDETVDIIHSIIEAEHHLVNQRKVSLDG